MPDVQALIAQLQDALGLNVTCGSITLNLADARVQSVKTETYQRVLSGNCGAIHTPEWIKKNVDKMRSGRQD